MDATVSIPLHFTLEILGLAASALLLAWATSREVIRERWLVGLGALSLGVGQAVHAGAFVDTEDNPALIALRLAGIVLIAVGGADLARRDQLPAERELLAGGLAALVAGTLWGSIAGGSTADLVVGAHVLTGVGGLALLVWGWRASRPTVHLRVLASFVIVLTIAIVVSGGAVARVAALDKRTAELDQLRPALTGVRQLLIAAGTDLTGRAATFSPQVARPLQSASSGTVTMPAVSLGSGEGAVLIDRTGRARGSTGTVPSDLDLASSPTFATAIGGGSSSLFVRSDDALIIVGLAPVFRPGGTATAGDVIGVVGITSRQPEAALRDAARAFDPEARVSVVDADRLGNTELPELALSARLPDGPYLVFSASESDVIDATNGLMRALLVALLASALLAVITASWLSVRIARPMLDLADEAERVKTDFLASVSHELRTPLTPIRGYTEILQRGRIPTARATGYLDEIGQAAQRMERIVTLLVDVASLEAGRLRADLRPVATNDVVNDAVERWASRGLRRRIGYAGAATLPRVSADGELIARVLDELIDNAIKFSPANSEVEVRAKKAQRGVEISVADAGPGLEPEQLKALTGAFRQADGGDTRKFGGLGLGLSFVRGALALHGARLSVRNAPTGGTVASFTLPTAGSVGRVTSKKSR